ncbi:nuclear transport factor 2 family protein [cf. Phormidesmis sp. LEGE 11477]|uniref:nuclear transport factor 2 family protein n=1 Tax=cf. Phormidesmis sp. LEGE 11477 TaxID=1828680 RepID=UPI001881D16B|nr:nuclear transport factor 2 family protein [cf. Phormidesmis sp. LEGE 11477]MBE9062265.1 nuclear transport factor 2 family protein [cf. Phormidesmis sp. LEGE 11477]
MIVSTISKNRLFFDQHLEAIAAGDIEKMVNRDYAEGAVLTTFFNGFADQPAPITVKGRSEIKKFFKKYMDVIGEIDVQTLDFTEANGNVFFQATFTCDLGLMTVGDAWVMKEGKIATHFGFFA